MNFKKNLKKNVFLIALTFIVFKSDASSYLPTEPTRCPNSIHMTLSCGVEYDFCNGTGVIGFFMAMRDWIISDFEYCDGGIVEPILT